MDILLGGDLHRRRRRATAAATALRGAVSPRSTTSSSSCRSTSARRRSTRQAKAAGFDNWMTYFIQFQADWRRNPELPVLMPWRTVTPINTPNWVLERNPFYYAVDTEGNQLPYIDKIQMTLAENLEVLNLRAIAGEYDIAGAPHGPRQAAGLPGEPAEGQLQRPARPGRERRRRRAPDQPELRRPTRRSAKWLTQPRLPPRALDGDRPRPVQRDVLARDRDARLGRTGRGRRRTAPARSGGRSGPRWTSSRRTSCWTRSGWTRRTPRGSASATTARVACASSSTAAGGQFLPFAQIVEMVAQHVEEDRHPARRHGAGARRLAGAASRRQRAPDR